MQTFTPSLTYGCSFEFAETIKEIAFGEGYAQRAPDGINSKRLVSHLAFANLRSRKAADIIRFLEEHGGTQRFLFTPPAPHDEQIVCVVKTPWTHTANAFDDESLDVTFMQDFATPPRVKTPTLTASAQTAEDFTLTIACATSGAAIYWTYSPDSWPPRPTQDDTLYLAPLTGRPFGFYRARAIKANLLNSLTGESEITA